MYEPRKEGEKSRPEMDKTSGKIRLDISNLK
jgi:hypothetical protein